MRKLENIETTNFKRESKHNKENKQRVNVLSKIHHAVYRMIPLLVFVFLILLWEFIVVVLEIKDYIAPRPTQIISEFKNSGSLLLEHTLITVYETLLGLCIAIIFAIVLSLICSKYKLAKRVLYPLAVVSQNVPLMAIAPLFIMWFGFGILSKILVVVLVGFFPVLLNTVKGLESYDLELVDMMRYMQASDLQIFMKVKIPAALPSFFSGLKIASAYSIMGAVVSEWVGAKNGLGIFLTRSMKYYNMPGMFADIIVIVVLSLMIFRVIEFVESKVIRWNINRS